MLQERLRLTGVEALLANEEARMQNLAGMFETGGHVGFRVQQDRVRKHRYVYAVFRMNNDASRTQALYEIYGGNRCLRTPISWAWGIRGFDAFELAVAIEPFAPARASVIDAIRRCEQLKTFEDRLEVRNSQERPYMRLDLDPRAYKDLVKLPAFVAGVLNAREVFYSEERQENIFCGIDVASKNIPLLLALQQAFGGGIKPRFKEGQEVKIKGRVFKIRDASSVWCLRDRTTKDVLEFTAPYVLIPESDSCLVENILR